MLRRGSNVSKGLSVGMVSNEIIHSATSRTGGFGYGTRVLIRTVEERGRGTVRYLTANPEFAAGFGSDESMADEKSFYRSRNVPDLVRYKLTPLHMLALLDYRREYQYFLRHRPKLPVLIWARDPRSNEDNARFMSLREPGFPDDIPAQAEPPKTESLRRHLFPESAPRRRHVIAVSTPYLRGKLEDAYGVVPEITPHLCTVIPTVEPAEDTTRPTVGSLARLDPQKRPWIMVELARRMPDVDFVMAGKTHAQLRWEPTDLPDNLKLIGEVKGESKAQFQRDCWVLLNTAIHEALPVSWLETLGTGTPLVSCLDPEGVVSSFGRSVPFVGGVGYEMLPDLEIALRELLEDEKERRTRGVAGQEWIRKTHNADNFIRAFDEILGLLGLDEYVPVRVSDGTPAAPRQA